MKFEPQWTDRGEKRGLDPLGLQNSGIALYQSLLPGISNVTPRLRYFGYYCWVSDTYARRVGKTDLDSWRTWVRRSEALLALVSALAGGETAVGGIEWATDVVLEGHDEIDFREAAGLTASRVYLRQAMGIFGAAYVSQLLETGLFALSPEHNLPIASARSGRALAEAFRNSIQEVEPLLIDALETGVVTRLGLGALRIITPSHIPGNSAESDLYRALLTGSSEAVAGRDASRRDTLRLALTVGEGLGGPVTSDAVRWRLFDPSLGLPEGLAGHRLSWEAYHAHDLFQVGAAGLFAWGLGTLGAQDWGLTYDEMAARLEMTLEPLELFDSEISWGEFRDTIGERDLRAAATALGRSSTLPEDTLEAAITIIATLHHRVSSRPDLAQEISLRFDAGPSSRSIFSELAWFDQRSDQPVGQTLGSYLVERVFKRHAEVAMRKLRYQRDYTFHFECRDGRLIRRLDHIPGLTSPRLGSAIQMLTDLDLLNDNGTTPAGSQLLRHAYAAA